MGHVLALITPRGTLTCGSLSAIADRCALILARRGSLLVDALRCIPLETAEQQRQALAQFVAVAQRSGKQARDHHRKVGLEPERVIGEYTPGTGDPGR